MIAFFLLLLLPVQGILSQDIGSIDGLVVRPENRCSEYNSADYPYSQSLENELIRNYGGIYSPYTGVWFLSKTETDIEHIVAKSEAHDSGLCSSSETTKRAFASDLLNLTLASPSVNRNQKRQKDAADWIPGLNQCWFANRVVEVKLKYNLSVDMAEKNALLEVLSRCPDTEMKIYVNTPAESERNTTTTAATTTATAATAENFKNCTELRKVYPDGVREGHRAYNPKMDRDKDGYACE